MARRGVGVEVEYDDDVEGEPVWKDFRGWQHGE
jgi:hypothetical protein